MGSDATDEPRLGEVEVRDLALSVMTTKLEETLGKDHLRLDPEGKEFVVPATLVDGEPIQLDTLTLTDLRFHPNVRSARSSFGTGADFDGERDVWLVSWARSGVTVPGWDVLAEVRLTLVLDDNTGEVLTMNLDTVNPELIDQSAP